MSENSSKLILAGGILGLVFLIIFGLFLSDVENAVLTNAILNCVGDPICIE